MEQLLANTENLSANNTSSSSGAQISAIWKQCIRGVARHGFRKECRSIIDIVIIQVKDLEE